MIKYSQSSERWFLRSALEIAAASTGAKMTATAPLKIVAGNLSTTTIHAAFAATP
jgi:hypothetical protein